MTSKKRVHRALQRKPVDRVPIFMWYHPQTRRRLGKLLEIPAEYVPFVMGDDIRQAVAGVPVQANGSGEISKPVNPPIIDSVTIVSTNTEYGLVMLKAAPGATVGETTTISVATTAESIPPDTPSTTFLNPHLRT